MHHTRWLASSRRSTKRPATRQHDFLARQRANVPVTVTFPHPLSWWRVRPADNFKRPDVCIARRFLAKTAIVGEPYWFAGASGNAAVAINVARRVQRQGAASLVSIDVAMTAVLCIALEGSLTAALFLAAALKRRTHIDPRCAALSDSWLSYRPPRVIIVAT